MKKEYLAPESEYINFDAEDLLTSVQTLGGINDYPDTEGDGIDGEVGTKSDNEAVNPWAPKNT